MDRLMPLNRYEFQKKLEDALQIKEKKKGNPDILIQIQKFLGEDSFNSNNIANWRRRQQLPKSMLQGAALAYMLFEKTEEDFKGTESQKELFEKVHDLYSSIIGLEFGAVEYCCELKKGSRKNFLDAVVSTTYSHPKVNSDFGRVKFQIRNVTSADLNVDKSVEVEVDSQGPGVKQCTKNWELVEYKRKKKMIRRRIEFCHEMEIDTSANAETKIMVKRVSKNSFPLSPKDVNETIHFGGYKVSRPTSYLSLRLIFPDGVLKSPKDIPVQIYAWGPWSLLLEDFDFHRMSSKLVSNVCQPRGELEWFWESQMPPMMGMMYALAYDTYDTVKQLYSI